MPNAPDSRDVDPALLDLLAPVSADVRDLLLTARAMIRDAVPDALEEIDLSARLLGFTFIPGTYKGMFAGITLQKDYVNIMFSKGVELTEIDSGGLLEGTGKVARHIKVRSADVLADPRVRALVVAAAARTPR